MASMITHFEMWHKHNCDRCANGPRPDDDEIDSDERCELRAEILLANPGVDRETWKLMGRESGLCTKYRPNAEVKLELEGIERAKDGFFGMLDAE